MFLYNPRINLRLYTPIYTVEQVLGALRELISAHPKTLDIDQRVRFQALLKDALEIHVFVYIQADNYFDYLVIVEELNFTLMKTLEEAGVGLTTAASEDL